MGSITWGSEIAEVYDETYAALFGRSVIHPLWWPTWRTTRSGAICGWRFAKR
jgi:hypothetical protein